MAWALLTDEARKKEAEPSAWDTQPLNFQPTFKYYLRQINKDGFNMY